MNHKIKILFLLIFSSGIIFGTNNIDSLQSSLLRVNDTAEIKVLLEIAKYYKSHGNIPKAINFCERAIELSKNRKDVFFLASAFHCMGNIYNSTGNFSMSLDYHLKSYHLLEKTSYKKLLYKVSNGLGNSYLGQKKLKKSFEFYNKAYNIALGLNDSYVLSVTLFGKGNVCLEQNNYEDAMSLFSQAYNGFRETKHEYEGAMAQIYIGDIYLKTNKNDKAIKILTDVYPIMQKLDEKYGIGLVLLKIGTAHRQKGNYQMALINYYKSMHIFKASSDKYHLKDVSQEIAITYNKQGKNDSAFHYIQHYALIKDVLYSEENSKLIAEMQTKYESVKKEEENKSLLVQNELSKNKLEQQNRLQIGLFLFLGVVFLFSIFLYRANKQKQKDNLMISIQKEKVENQRMTLHQKNKEILDSITYSKRLQEAILPPIKTIQKYLPELFILFKPKDIVSGDFYWMEVFQNEQSKAKTDLQNNSFSNFKIFIAAADCTGHGVPGAIVSVVCSNSLNRAVKEFGITDPGKILDKTRELVIETFVREDSYGELSEVKDGMDISLISIEYGAETDGKVNINWAGANNPLWIIKKNNNEELTIDNGVFQQLTTNHQLMEIKANKQSIGKMDDPLPFTTHSMQLNKGDQLYLFTDGYSDQFGGEKGKKFKHQQLKELLLDNSHLSMQEQRKILNDTIEKWKGNLEQVDDILIIGIKV